MGPLTLPPSGLVYLDASGLIYIGLALITLLTKPSPPGSTMSPNISSVVAPNRYSSTGQK